MKEVCTRRAVFITIHTILLGYALPFGIKHIPLPLPGERVAQRGRRRKTQRNTFITIVGIDILTGYTVVESGQNS